MAFENSFNIDFKPITNAFGLQNYSFGNSSMNLSAPLFNFPNTLPALNMDTFNFDPFGINSKMSTGAFNPANISGIDWSTVDWAELYDQSVQMCLNNAMRFNNFNFNYDISGCPSLKDVKYNKNKASALASNVVMAAGPSSKKLCAKYVNNAIERAGISVVRGDAYQMAENLRNNKNFKEVKVTQEEFKHLPPGCVIVYPRGSAGYSAQYGHIEITLGNGRSASDFVNNNTKYSPDVRVFVPV